jgi:hypothetical protein
VAAKQNASVAGGILSSLWLATDMLDRVRMSVRDLRHPNHGRAVTGAYTIAVFGRALTQALETIRTHDRDHFNSWWPSKAVFMATDPLLVFFDQLRNAFLHEGCWGRSGDGGLVVWKAHEHSPQQPHVLYFAGSTIPTHHAGQVIPVQETYPGDGETYLPFLPAVETLGILYERWLAQLVRETWTEFLPGIPPFVGAEPPLAPA